MQPTAGSSSRRQILIASITAAGGGAAALIASCGSSEKKKPAPVETLSTGQIQSDTAILNALLDMEHSSAAAYRLLRRRLTGRARRLAGEFLIHEQAHAAAIAGLIVQIGGEPTPAQPRSTYERTFPQLGDADDALSLALDVERTAISAYSDVLTQVVTDDARTTLAAILVTESEHSAAVLGELGQPQVPEPFVNGPPPEDR